MAIDYGGNSVWGNDWRNAMANGNTAYAKRLESIMDMQAQTAPQVGAILAKTLDQGRGSTGAWAGGGDGLEYNTAGQSRTPGQGSYNTLTTHGYAVAPGQAQGQPTMGALDPVQTMTPQQYAVALKANQPGKAELDRANTGGVTGSVPVAPAAFGVGTTAGQPAPTGTKVELDLAGNPAGAHVPVTGGSAGSGGATFQHWTPPTANGGMRQADFSIANSLWDHNAQQYRNRQLARMLTR